MNTNDKHILFFEKQILDRFQSIRSQNNLIADMHLPITAPWKSLDFDRISDFSVLIFILCTT